MTQPQVAAVLGVSPTTVKRALAKALQTVGSDALAVDGVVAGQRFSARRAVARGGEPWRFAVAGIADSASDDAPASGPVSAPTVQRQNGPAAEAGAAAQIAWLRAEIERRDAALEQEQLANAELRRLLLALGGDPERATAIAPAALLADGDSVALRALTPAAVERAAKDAGIGKKQRRELLDRLAALAGPA